MQPLPSLGSVYHEMGSGLSFSVHLESVPILCSSWAGLKVEETGFQSGLILLPDSTMLTYQLAWEVPTSRLRGVGHRTEP